MSITFWIPDAPRVKFLRDCLCCNGKGKWFEDEPCLDCSGTGRENVEESSLPEVNMANGNALGFLRALVGDEADYSGTWSPQRCAELEPRLLLIENGLAAETLETPAVQDGNFILCGRSEEYVRAQAGHLRAVLSAAVKANMSVSWGVIVEEFRHPYHIKVRATFPDGFARTFDVPKGRQPLEYAVSAFAHSRLRKVELLDASGPLRVVSHTGELYG